MCLWDFNTKNARVGQQLTELSPNRQEIEDKTDPEPTQVVNQLKVCQLRPPRQTLFFGANQGLPAKPYQIPLVDRDTLFYTDGPVDSPGQLIQHFVCIVKIQSIC